MSQMQQSLTNEKEVLCDYGKMCVLPCSFEAGEDPIIRWYLTNLTKDLKVYTYDSKNHFQHRDYTGHFSLNNDLISRGNASLRIENVSVQDEGRYRCSIQIQGDLNMTDIRVKVRAPVGSVRLVQQGGKLVCTSEGIYPKPNVSWTNNSKPATDSQPSIVPSETGLFSVNSTVPLTDHYPQKYSCNVSNEYSWKSASYSAAEIPLSDSLTLRGSKHPLDGPVNSAKWTFNDKETICNGTGSEMVCSESWKPFVKKGNDTTTLELKDLPPDKKGKYTCEIETDSGTSISVTHVTGSVTSVGVMWSIIQDNWLYLAAAVIILMIAFLVCRHRKQLTNLWNNLMNNEQDRAAVTYAPASNQVNVEMGTNGSLEINEGSESKDQHKSKRKKLLSSEESTNGSTTLTDSEDEDSTLTSGFGSEETVNGEEDSTEPK